MHLHPSPDTIYDQNLLDDARYQILIAGTKSGEHSSFSGLWNRPSKEITITMYLNTRNRQSVEDALQEAFLKAVHYLQFVDKPTFSVRCCRTAIDSVLAIVGKKRVNPRAWMDWSVDGETWQQWKISDEMAKSDERFLREERERHLTEAIRKLRPTLRSIMEIQQLRNGSGTPKGTQTIIVTAADSAGGNPTPRSSTHRPMICK